VIVHSAHCRQTAPRHAGQTPFASLPIFGGRPGALTPTHRLINVRPDDGSHMVRAEWVRHRGLVGGRQTIASTEMCFRGPAAAKDFGLTSVDWLHKAKKDDNRRSK
jgi:hypothetical protein